MQVTCALNHSKRESVDNCRNWLCCPIAGSKADMAEPELNVGSSSAEDGKYDRWNGSSFPRACGLVRLSHLSPQEFERLRYL
jgi:hypothetical protein